MTANPPPDPREFVEVSREEFYRAMGPLNVTLFPDRDETRWETPSRALLGITRPGYMRYGADGRPLPRIYRLRAYFASTQTQEPSHDR